MSQDEKLCVFRVGPIYLGVDVGLVHEVLRPQPLTVVPLAAPEIVGLMNLRGQIITAIDLGVCLGRGESEPGTAKVNLILHLAGQSVSLLVDAVEDVIPVDDGLIEPPPTSLGAEPSLISAAYKLPDRLLLLIDVLRLIDSVHSPRASSH